MTTTAELRDQAVRVAGSLEPETMTGEQARAAVQDLATADKAIASTLLFTALRVARSSAWKGRGFATAADWLADVLGVRCARRRPSGTAKKADRLPKTKKAMKQGDLSPDQAGAVTDGADADPNAEDDLLDSAARDTNKALKDKAAKAKAADGLRTREGRIRSRRSLRRGTDAEGASGSAVRAGGGRGGVRGMFRPFEELLFRHGRSTGVRDTFENRSYDAFLAMLAHHTHLAHPNRRRRRDRNRRAPTTQRRIQPPEQGSRARTLPASPTKRVVPTTEAPRARTDRHDGRRAPPRAKPPTVPGSRPQRPQHPSR